MVWTVEFADEFEPEFDELPASVQDEIRAHVLVIAQFGPRLGRPQVETLRFYRRLISTADRRFGVHLDRVAGNRSQL